MPRNRVQEKSPGSCSTTRALVLLTSNFLLPTSYFLTAPCLTRRRCPASCALCRLRRLAFARLGLAFTLRAAPQTFRGCAQTAADALLLRLGAFLLRVAFGLRARIEFAADQFNLRDLGAIALAEAEAQQARVTAGPRRKARRDRVEQLRHDLAVLQILHDHAARVQHVAV